MSQTPPDLADLSLLSGLAPELASTFVRVASDVALVIGADGVISNAAEGPMPVRAAGDDWVGRAWIDTVTADTRRKIEMLLQEARGSGVSRRREVNHVGAGGAQIPVSWAAVRLGEHGPVLAVGRDLRAVAAIQQRFLDAQQELERDYWLRRQAEARYRQLFQVASDAVLVLDAATLAVIEANPTAQALFDGATRPLDGCVLADRVEPGSRAAIDELFVTARASGRAAEVRVRLAVAGGSGGAGSVATPIDVSATPFRADDRQCLLVRARSIEPSANFFEHTPDAAVITDSNGRVRMANAAFVKLCQAPDEARLRGWLLGDALGDIDRQWPALLAKVRTSGLVGRAVVRLNVAGSPPLLAEVSGALLAEGEQEDVGFTLRPLAEGSGPQPSEPLAQALADLVSRLGHQALPDLLLQATHLAESHLIEAALVQANGRVEAAAELLKIPAARLQQRMDQLGLARRPFLN
jgi:transcriptional regulator PpsR